jgi:hypothetical protein
MNNRRFKVVDKPTQTRLVHCFPQLGEILSYEGYSNYQHLSVTVYDHWLSEENAFLQLNNMPIEKQKIYDARLHSFVCNLTGNFESYLVKRVGRHKKNITFRAFTSRMAREDALRPQPYLVGDRNRFTFVIPHLKLIYIESCDFTHHVYLRDSASIDTLKNEAEKSGVYVL